MKINEINMEWNNNFIKNHSDKCIKVLSEYNYSYHDKWNLDINKDNDLEALSSKYYYCQRDKVLIITSYLYILLYTYSKNINLIQMVIGYYIFAKNMIKHCIKVFYQLSFFISGKTMR